MYSRELPSLIVGETSEDSCVEERYIACICVALAGELLAEEEAVSDACTGSAVFQLFAPVLKSGNIGLSVETVLV